MTEDAYLSLDADGEIVLLGLGGWPAELFLRPPLEKGWGASPTPEALARHMTFTETTLRIHTPTATAHYCANGEYSVDGRPGYRLDHVEPVEQVVCPGCLQTIRAATEIGHLAAEHPRLYAALFRPAGTWGQTPVGLLWAADLATRTGP